MTAISINTEHKTILEFNEDKLALNHVVSKLRAADFLEFKNDRNIRTYLSYDIKVGIYTIFVDAFHTQSCANKLKDYDRFYISISEGNKEIDISKDSRFSSEPWVMANKNLNLKTSHLAKAIVFCSRLNKLKLFL